MPRRNPAVKELPGHCPLCEAQLSMVPIRVGDYIGFEARCYGPHEQEDLDRATDYLNTRVT